jgi:hypothetical protein
MGDALPFPGEMVRPLATECQHDWEPVPLEVGHYHCTRCRMYGYRHYHRGVIVPYGDGGIGMARHLRQTRAQEVKRSMEQGHRLQRENERRVLEEKNYPDPRWFRDPSRD